ncbi:MAG: helix-turn-helix transcriptional regulator [Gammaproteobacteria bacterium]|nr:helix-turn-helix transcriptional regulator [Gammaproteobacteria bacterium]
MSTFFFDFDSDSYTQQVVALHVGEPDCRAETPFHQHRKCQLVMPVTGYIQSRIGNTLWMVPNGCAVWIPSQVPHNNVISPDASVCMLFVEPDVAGLPTESCTLAITPLLRELILHFCAQQQDYASTSATARVVSVIVDELTNMPKEQLDFPLPKEPHLHQIAFQLLETPADRRTIKEWALEFAMSERTFSRLVKQELHMSFGRWRGQLRVLLAVQRLSGGESVQTISEALGYESVSAFITYFKNTLGCSPMKYIRNKGN